MTTTSSTNPTASAASQILTSLNSGSGIDTAGLVSSLVEAQYAVKRDQLAARSDALQTQISDAASLLSGIKGFSSSLQTLVESGSLSTQPTSSNSDVLTVSALSGAKLDGLSASFEVTQLATAQTSASDYVADRTAAIGTGTFTLTFGTATVANGAMTAFTAGSGAPVDIVIDADHSSLDGIAEAINAADAGVTATIVTDSGGARLMLKSTTGAEQAFTLAAGPGSSAALAKLDVGMGKKIVSTIGTAAQDAIVVLDGISVTRSSNAIDDLIEGVKIDLLSAAPGKPVSIGNSRPIADLEQVVTDFVDTYNQLKNVIKADTNPISGSLSRDTAARTLMTSLSRLTLAPLTSGVPAGAPTTLAELGVATNRDGTLSVDADRLQKMLTDWPDVVEAMFADGNASGEGLPAALDAIADTAADGKYGLAASQDTYNDALGDLADQKLRIENQAAAMTERLTRQFASMDARVAAYKSTQSFLESQIDAWNKKD